MIRSLRLIPLAIGVRLTRFSIRILGFPRTVRMLRILARIPSVFDPLDPITQLAVDIDTVGGSPYHANCLHGSLFLWFLAHRRGLDAELRIGVVFNADELVGHAWVELDGAVINDEPDVAARYSVFEEDPTGIVFT